MQEKKYSIPSARSRMLIKRNTLRTLEQQANTDDTWLNDMYSGSLTAVSQTQEHTVQYEDLPTMPLSLLKPPSAPYALPVHAGEYEKLFDEDKTIKFEKRKKSSPNPLAPLLADETISVITALGPHRIYIERDGIIQHTALRFADEQHMLAIIEELLHTVGCTLPTVPPLSSQTAITDIRLPDGTLLTVALPPSAPNGPALTLRKSRRNVLTLQGLVKRGMLTQAQAKTLYTHVQARHNIIVCGHVGSGRTTFLNALCAAIPTHEQIVTIEDFAELRLQHPQVTVLHAQHLHMERAEHSTTQDLIAYAERVRANRLIVGECRNDGALALLQAMYNGLNGVMTTLYATSVKDCLMRFETLCLLASKEHSPAIAHLLRAQIAQSVHAVVVLSQEHKVVDVEEVKS